MRLLSCLLASAAFSLAACGGGGSGTVTNTPPVVTQNTTPNVTQANADQSANVGYEFSYDATQNGQTFTDPDGDALTFSVTFAPDNGDFTAVNGTISGTPSVAGTVTATISANDGNASRSDSFVISTTIRQTAISAEFGATIDLTAMAAYENPVVPAHIGAPSAVQNPITDAGATLGRVLFYDRALSINDTVSCASCHRQARAFGDPRTVSTGVQGGMTGRHSMRLINTMFSDEAAFFWDERAANLEAQVTQPIRDHNEHGFSGQNGRPDFDDLITKLEGIDYYDELFRFAFGSEGITEERMQSALAQFVNSIVSFDSKYDTGRAQVTDPFASFPNFTLDENEGKNLYMSGPQDLGAGCRSCHADPVFSIFENSGHIGVIGVAGDPAGVDMTNTRSPSMRDLFRPDGSLNGPFMHDGSMTTMRQVLDHYDKIPVPTTEPLRTEFMNSIDPQLIAFDDTLDLNLSDAEKDQIEAFLRTLSGNNVYTDPKWSNPF